MIETESLIKFESDAITEILKGLIEIRTVSYLWVPGDTPPFKPRLLPTIYGDGRALFALASCNQRPRYWVIRGDSRWSCNDAPYHDNHVCFGSVIDDVISDLENFFMSGRCGYSGSSLFEKKKNRACKCEECSDKLVAKFPAVDEENGISWRRLKWPDGFDTEPHPWSWSADLLGWIHGHG